ncbi:MAG: dihydrodipicolinate synthase family protein [Anaerolineae bacterium]
MLKSMAGIYNILATPFHDDRSLDEAGLRQLVAFQMALGAHGLTILGVLGEAAKLSVPERARVLEIVMAVVDGSIPIVVGTSHPDQATCIELSQQAFAAGAQGVMIAPPRLTNPTDAIIFDYYKTIASEIDGVIVVQDFPPINGVIMSAELIGRITADIPQAKCLKLEDPPLMEKISAIRQYSDDMLIFGGLGGMFLLEELGRGASGTMTGFAFTEILVAIYQAFGAGQVDVATRIFDHYLPLIRFENQPVINLTIRKALLHRRGAMPHPHLREPYAPIDAGTQSEMDSVLRRVGIDDPTQKITFDNFYA